MAEFDAYAANYDAGMDNPLKRMAGASADDFIALKVDWLLEDLRRSGLATDGANVELLDYGCGAGLFLRHLRRAGFGGRLTGCDIAQAMLAEARRAWTEGDVPALDLIDNAALPYPSSSFDAVILCAMLHHVPPMQRAAVAHEAQRVLKPDGRIYVFEHNPFNPITAWVVRHTPIDQEAILLTAGEARARLRTAAVTPSRTEHLMFFPPRWRWTRKLEKWLRWLPMGGQYVVVGSKASSAST
jgi:ubiquinone/menaquinone biosynthesis C-methylase UbiE